MSGFTNSLALSALALCLISCTTMTSEKDLGLTTTYNCGGMPLATQMGSDDAMRLNVGGRVFPVIQVQSASGAKYENLNSRPKVMFWSKGDEAMLELDGKTYPTCKIVRGSDIQNIKNYRAIGNKPAWFLAINNGQMTFNSRYGEKVVTADLPNPKTSDMGQSYTLKTGKQDMVISIKRKSCQDTVSGQYYPDQVNISFLGEEMRGCGNALSGTMAEEELPLIKMDAASAPQAVEPPAFVGKTWIAQTIEGKPVLSTSRVTLSFDENGNMSGNGGCNLYVGTYKTKGTSIEIDDNLGLTRKACGLDVTKQEMVFTTILKSSKLVDVRNDTLILSTPHRKTLTFVESTGNAPLTIMK